MARLDPLTVTTKVAALAVLAVLAVTTSACSGGTGGVPPSERPVTTGTVTATPSPPDLVGGLGERVVIAHRGGGREHPEGTLEAFEAAARSGFVVDLDLRMLGDGTLVPLHDGTLDRTTDGTGRPGEITKEQWADLRVDVGPGPPVETSTWDDVLDELGGRALLAVEVKSSAGVPAFIASVVDRGLQRSTIAQSSSFADVEATAAAGIPSMLLSTSERDFEKLQDAGVEMIGFWAKGPGRAEYVAAATNAGMRVAIWTLNEAEAVGGAFDEGAFAVFTDDPWGVRDALE